jgi:hypothetical protein
VPPHHRFLQQAHCGPEVRFETIISNCTTILTAAWEAASMAHRKTSERSRAKTVLGLPDLKQSKNAALHSLAAASSQESYGHAIDEFISWYCSEPRLAFNRTVVLRYRFFRESSSKLQFCSFSRGVADATEKVLRHLRTAGKYSPAKGMNVRCSEPGIGFFFLRARMIAPEKNCGFARMSRN